MRKAQAFATQLAIMTVVLAMGARTTLTARLGDGDSEEGAGPVESAIIIGALAIAAGLVVVAVAAAVNAKIPNIK